MTTSASGSALERLLFPVRGPDCSVSSRGLASGGTVADSRSGTWSSGGTYFGDRGIGDVNMRSEEADLYRWKGAFSTGREIA